MTDHNEHNIVPLTFPGSGEKVRVVWLDDQPHWVVNDVCRELGIESTHNAAARLFSDYLRTTGVVDGRGQMRETNVVNEPGLYQLVFMSRKPKAEAFRRWIFEEVIPAIRRTGSYQSAEDRKAKVLEALEAGDASFRKFENAKQRGEIPSWVAQEVANVNGILTEMMQFPAVLTTSGQIDEDNGVIHKRGGPLTNGNARSAMYKKVTGRLPFKAPMRRKDLFRIVNCYLEEDVRAIKGFHDKQPKAIDK
jgi:prophage antirepressor-like protein